MVTKIVMNGLHSSEKECASMPEDLISKQVFNILTLAAGMKDMHLDKCGATAVFSAFQTIVQEGVKINLTVSMGFVENFLDAKSYRPSDIITSRKGLTVEIGNTDAKGRLVLADCMNWTQENYKTKVMIELSTLTGAMIFALGHRFAGGFTNSENLVNDLIKAGKQVHEEVWHMPLVDYHRELVKHKYADITNSSGKPEAGSSQAAAFLENFVEQNVEWIHLDVAGMAMQGGEGTGYGPRLLIQYARNYSCLTCKK